jgi:putative ABC transport system ATP-binding protein
VEIGAKTPCTTPVKYVHYKIQMALIEINDVSKLFGFGDATTVALDEVNFNVEKGEFVAIMGPSGSGKSTLMNIIGLLDHPTHGTYKLNGRLSTRLRNSQRSKLRRDTIGFVFQSFNLLPRMTVIENVALPLAYKGMTPVRRAKRASEILDRVGLGDREYYYPRHLSGGQIQRAAIARALINSPSLIIADEPTGNLDSLSSRVVMELLSEIHKSGNTILMVTHNPELTRYANRVVYMHDGAIIHDEKSAIGEVPRAIKKTMYFAPQTTEDDDLAGISALMKVIPGGDTKKVRSKKAKKSAKKSPVKKTRVRKTRSRSNT